MTAAHKRASLPRVQIPTYVYVLAPLVIVAFVVQLVLRGRSAARSARGMARSLRNVVAVDKQRPTTGELATALAVGAHMSLGHGVSWNALKDDANSAQKIYANLKNQWDVNSPAQLRECLDGLLDDETGDPIADFVLKVRQPEPDAWRAAVTEAARSQGVPETTIAEMTATVDRVLGYEERFRADGLLPPDGQIKSLLAYDWGRAVNMARWGYKLRWISEQQAQEYVLRAGKQAFARYGSWTELSAGYAMGRVLRFDNDEFDVWYATVLEAHQVLTTDPASPWLTLPWPAGR